MAALRAATQHATFRKISGPFLIFIDLVFLHVCEFCKHAKTREMYETKSR
jgi:hypothetical protein